eukprot:403355378
MKRTFGEISNSNLADDKQLHIYGNETKRRKLQAQRIGDFIVDARQAINFRLSSDINKLEDLQATTLFFSPQFVHFVFGKDERISGYEGLSIDITLSKKKLMPFVQFTYENKAPAFANIDNINDLLLKHYGRISERPEDFIKNPQRRRKLSSVIEPSPFWKYFLIYEKISKNLLAFATVFEAHHSVDSSELDFSVLVLPPYQKQGGKMKRTFGEISNSNLADDKQLHIYGNETKRRKLQAQRIGDFIVDARQAINFRLSSDINKLEDLQATTLFFSPQFVHFVFGKDERISGYEGLSIDITLSKKKLMPFVQFTYENKAPAFANIDNINDLLLKHYGRISERPEDFIKILKEEENFVPLGDKLKDIIDGEKEYEVYKVSLDNEAFHEQNFYLQSILPFFIDGASVIEPSPFWKYFLIYEKISKNLLAFATVFEAHHSVDKFRARISQVLVLPPYQKQGLGQKLYQSIFDHYRLDEEKCFQVIVEDAADDFQRLQDHLNAKVYLKANTKLTETLKSLPISNVILNQDQLKRFTISRAQIQEYAKSLKLPEQIVLRLHELVLFSFLEKNDSAQRAFRIQVKKRYYVRLVKDHIKLFTDTDNQILGSREGGLKEPYLFNDQLEENPFFRDRHADEEQKDNKQKDGEKILIQEGIKIELKNIYDEVQKQYSELRDRINALITQNKLN